MSDDVDSNCSIKDHLSPSKWVINASVLGISAAIIYKTCITPVSITLDFSALLSLLLALFSVALSALFYFKATETSNSFYDNTYKFTKDIAALLVRIESGFGERLRHLDEGYTSMRDRLTNGYPAPSFDDAKKELKAEEAEVKAKENERNKLIEELLKKAQIENAEKDKIRAQMIENERALAVARQEMALLKIQLEQLGRSEGDAKDAQLLRRPLPGRAHDFIANELVDRLGGVDVVRNMSLPRFRTAFNRISGHLPQDFLEELRFAGFRFSGYEILPSGAERLHKILLRKLDKQINNGQ